MYFWRDSFSLNLFQKSFSKVWNIGLFSCKEGLGRISKRIYSGSWDVTWQGILKPIIVVTMGPCLVCSTIEPVNCNNIDRKLSFRWCKICIQWVVKSIQRVPVLRYSGNWFRIDCFLCYKLIIWRIFTEWLNVFRDRWCCIHLNRWRWSRSDNIGCARKGFLSRPNSQRSQ